MNDDWVTRLETERFDHPIQHEVMRIHAERVRRFYHPTLAETIGKSAAEREEQRAVREAQEANALEFVKSRPDRSLRASPGFSRGEDVKFVLELEGDGE